jgi:hypothetical protein
MEQVYLRLFIFVFVFMAGCRNEVPLPGPVPQPVRGKLTYQGRPARAFRVVFNPINKWEGAQFTPSAVTDENGEFRLCSYKPGDGAPEGEYAVTFTWPKRRNNVDEEDGTPPVDQLQKRYADPKKSVFRVTVKGGDNELATFALQ